jgi:hypothetical protein
MNDSRDTKTRILLRAGRELLEATEHAPKAPGGYVMVRSEDLARFKVWVRDVSALVDWTEE